MRISLVPMMLLVLISSVLVNAQKSGVRPRPGPKPVAAFTAPRVPLYQLHLRIDDDNRLFMSVFSESPNEGLNATGLSTLITDLPSGASHAYQPNTVFPIVSIEPSERITMLGLWNPITLFPKDRTKINIVFERPGQHYGDTLAINVPWRSSGPDKYEVKPNPLLLVVTTSDDGVLSLNNEIQGKLSDPAPLISILSRVFREREENAVFRENTNEVEKTVVIVLPMGSRRVTDLLTIAKALRDAGSDRIDLEMESPFPEPIEFDFEPPIAKPIRPKTKQ